MNRWEYACFDLYEALGGSDSLYQLNSVELVVEDKNDMDHYVDQLALVKDEITLKLLAGESTDGDGKNKAFSQMNNLLHG